MSLSPSNLSHNQSLIPNGPLLLSPPLISYHSHTDSARWLSRDCFYSHPSLPVHQSLHIRYHSEDKVPNPSPVPPRYTIQITIFPSFFPLLTSTKSMWWWRNNTDIWSYSICTLGPGPKSIIISSPGTGGWVGSCRALGHQSAGEDFLKGFKNRGSFHRHLWRTHLLPSPRFPRAKFDVPCDQLISSCKGHRNNIIES